MAADQFILIPGISPLPGLKSAGGKGLSLWKLIEQKFPVPPFFILSADYFRQEKFKNEHPFVSDGLSEQILETIRIHLGTYDLFSVRSSAVQEDGSHYSFAGQFKTVLNVKAADVPAAIEEVMKSASSETVLAYLNHQKKEGSGAEMAVIIQAMIPSDKSGVGFSIDPVTGNRNCQRISAVTGLGELLVSGEVNADEYTVSRNQEILFLQTGKQPHSAIDSGVLSEGEIKQVSELIRTSESFFGRYQDIEWTFAKGKLYLLQSRPVTTFSALPDRSDHLTLWDNSNITESYPGMTSPLTFSFIEDIYREVYQQFCKVLGVETELISANHEVFSMLGHLKYRVYYNLGNWYQVLSLLPGYEINSGFMEQMMGVKEKGGVTVKTVPSRQNKYVRLIRMVFHLLREWIRIESSIRNFYIRFQAALDKVPDEFLRNQPPSVLKSAYQKLEKNLITRWDAPLVNDFFAMIAFGLLVKQLEKLNIDQPKSTANLLLMDEGGIISTEPAADLRVLAEKIRENQDLTDKILACSYPTECVRLIRSEQESAQLFDLYRKKFGNRWAEELKLETITPATQPELIIPLIKVYLTSGSFTKSADLSSDKNKAIDQIEGKLGPFILKKAGFRWVLNQARNRVKSRENLRFERTRLFAKIRTIFTEWGEYYFRNDIISSPRDIFFLTKEELFRFSEGTSPDVDLKALIESRKKDWNEAQSVRLPERIKTFGSPFSFNQLIGEEPPVLSGDLSGLGCSKGKIRGKVKVVHSPGEIEGLSGCILVAEKTDPGWTPLFPLAKGLIIERGSLLSHAAIVAREMGIPAIVSVPGVMTVLTSGMWVEMDGSTGMIVILEGENQHE